MFYNITVTRLLSLCFFLISNDVKLGREILFRLLSAIVTYNINIIYKFTRLTKHY